VRRIGADKAAVKRLGNARKHTFARRRILEEQALQMSGELGTSAFSLSMSALHLWPEIK
jgi:hypothetical protein